MEKVAPNGVISASHSEEEFCILKCKGYNELPGNLHLQDGYNCDKCNNKGLIAEPREKNGHWFDVSVICECRPIRRTIRRMNRSGLKNILRDYTFKSFETETELQKAMKEAAMRFCKDEENNWFFAGGASGCGKTHICTAIAGYLLRHEHKEVRYMLWRDDVVNLRGNADPEVRAKAMHEFKTAEVLYIDDLFKSGRSEEGGTQRPTVADINVAFELLNYRYNNPQLITIISSECTTMDILSIDEAIGGRIAEKTAPYGYGINVKPGAGKNYRLKGLVEL